MTTMAEPLPQKTLVTAKVCGKCNLEKPLDAYHRDETKRHGRRSHCRACMAEYHAANRERILKQKAEYQQRNAEYRADYRRRNAESIADYNRSYRQQRPEAHIASRYRRRGGTEVREITTRDLRRMLQRQRNCCALCGVSFTGEPGSRHVDHVVPLALGGRHSIGNLAYLCRSCNRMKSDRPLISARVALTRLHLQGPESDPIAPAMRLTTIGGKRMRGKDQVSVDMSVAVTPRYELYRLYSQATTGEIICAS